MASGSVLRHIRRMHLLNERFLWASMLWGAVASGYWIYGWRQKSAIPLAGGAVMMIASCCLSALVMTLACLAVMGIVYWLVRQGY